MNLSDFEPDYIDRLHNRFWTKVDKQSPDGCWEWTARIDYRGYGRIGAVVKGKSRVMRAHRISYLLRYGQISADLHICHHCDNPPCVNPAHLFAGYPVDNVHDMIKKGRDNFSKGESEHPNGEDHPITTLTEEDVIAIRKLRSEQELTYRELGRRFNVSHVTIGNIVKRKYWTHV